MILKLLLLYLAIMNVVGFLSMGADKRKAVAHQSRTPERRLIMAALLGGSIGSLLGMFTFRHKTRHLKFALGLPLIVALQLLIAAAIALCFK